MTAPIEDVSSLPGKKLNDQLGVSIGQVKEVYAMDDGFPMWVVVETKVEGDKRLMFVPLARVKEEEGELLVPYSKDHVLGSPEVDGDDGLSEEADQELRGYFGIGTGDQELWADNKSYAAVVSEKGGEAQRVEDTDQLETPDPDRRTDESQERLENPGSAEARKVTGEDAFGGAGDGGSGDDTEENGEAKPEGGQGSRGE
jgi:hypothetical protein